MSHCFLVFFCHERVKATHSILDWPVLKSCQPPQFLHRIIVQGQIPNQIHLHSARYKALNWRKLAICTEWLCSWDPSWRHSKSKQNTRLTNWPCPGEMSAQFLTSHVLDCKELHAGQGQCTMILQRNWGGWQDSCFLLWAGVNPELSSLYSKLIINKCKLTLFYQFCNVTSYPCEQ